MIVRVSGAAVGAGTKTPWWEKGTTSNMKEVKSVQQLVDELANAGDKLVIVEFYAPWCNACRALYPKVCQIMDEHLEDIIFLKVSFEDNKEMCKMLGIRVLPFFQFFHGAQGKVDEFSCSISKLPRLKEAVALHSAAICSLWPRRQAAWLDEFPEVLPSAAEPFAYADRLTTLAYKDD